MTPLLAALALAAPLIPFSPGQDVQGDPNGDAGVDLTALSLEELMQVQVTSVSRKAQPIETAAAAVYVITAEDIRRSGHASLAEVLRMVPGLHVSVLGSGTWAVGLRGFPNRYADKLLVMVDGRSIYTNLYSGVKWGPRDVPLELIDRIEVVRGPGGTMWGANAVNGVIHIHTKSASETQGLALFGRAGTPGEGIGSGYYGGPLGEWGSWRAYGRWRQTGGHIDLDGGEHPDHWALSGGGFRADWSLGERDSLTLQLDAYDGRLRQSFDAFDPITPAAIQVEETIDEYGFSVRGHWSRVLERGQLDLQVYVDVARQEAEIFIDHRDTYDLDLQHRIHAGPDHDLVWGLGLRIVEGDLWDSPVLSFQDLSRTDHLVSAFVQDEWSLTDDLRLTLGAKFEHNDTTGVEVQPNARLHWTLDDASSVWAAVSRAVHTPSVFNHELFQPVGVIPGPPPVVTALVGNEGFDSEELIAYELGYRTRPAEGMFLDLTAFYFDYDRLHTLEPGTPFLSAGTLIQPLLWDNKGQGESVGFEAAADLQAGPNWRLRSALSLLEIEVDTDASDTPGGGREVDDFPSYTASLMSFYDVGEDVDFDLGFYLVDDLNSEVDGYLRADARLAWRPRAGLELAAGVQNALEDEHQEFDSGSFSTASLVERAFYTSLVWAP